MAAFQPARGGVAETVTEFMARRAREVGRLGADAGAAGREAWAMATRSGGDVEAIRPGDVLALGARLLDQRAKPQPVIAASAAKPQRPAPGPALRGPVSSAPRSEVTSARPNTKLAATPVVAPLAARMYVPPAEDLPELRRQQAELGKVRRDLDRENSWLAIGALAAPAAVLMLEGGAALTASVAAPQLRKVPLVLKERMPYLRVGDNWATRAGRRAHKTYGARANAKPGWDAEQGIKTENGLRRPDIRAPARKPDPKKRFQMELKPNTPSGRRAAARAVRRYEEDTGNKTRAIFYDPKDFM